MLKAITILAVFLGVFTASFTMTDAKPKGPTVLQRKILKEFRKNPQQCPMYSEDLILSSSDGELIELLLNTCPIEGIPAEKLKQLLPKEPQKQEEQISVLHGKDYKGDERIIVRESEIRAKILERLRERHRDGYDTTVTEEMINNIPIEKLMEFISQDRYYQDIEREVLPEDFENQEEEIISAPTEENDEDEEEQIGTSLLDRIREYEKELALAGGITVTTGALVGAQYPKLTEEEKKRTLSQYQDKEEQQYRKNFDKLFNPSKDTENEKVVKNAFDRILNATGRTPGEGNIDVDYCTTGEKCANAECFPNGYIKMSDGMVEKFGRNEDMVASIAAHEVKHFDDQIELQKVAASKTRSREIIAETSKWYENDADSGAFYLCANAGYNVGAQAAAFMALEGEESAAQSLIETTEKECGQTNIDNPHPKIEDRIERSLKRINKYSNGHVEVKRLADKKHCTVYTDGEEVMTANNKDACFKAGELARDFHEAG